MVFVKYRAGIQHVDYHRKSGCIARLSTIRCVLERLISAGWSDLCIADDRLGFVHHSSIVVDRMHDRGRPHLTVQSDKIRDTRYETPPV